MDTSREDRTRLTEVYEILWKTPLPPAPDMDELAEWRADLIEMDAFYMGIANTVLNEGQVVHHLHELDTLETTLGSIDTASEKDQAIRDKSFDYVQALKELRHALVRCTAKP